MPRAHAQAWVPAKGQGVISLSYQQLRITNHTDIFGNAQSIGEILDRALYLNIDYGLSDRWAINFTAPYKSNRYVAGDSGGGHNPADLPPAFRHGQRFIDDGRFRGGWADWSASVRYQWRTEPLLITPFITYSMPSHAYDFFAESADGTRQWALTGGVNIGKRITTRPFQNLYWQAGYSYSFMQSKDNRRVNHDDLTLEAGYFISPRIGAHVSLERFKSYNGISDAEFFNPDGTPNWGFITYHDSLLAVSYTKFGVGMDYQLNANYQLYVDYGKTLKGTEVHLIDYAATFGIRRSF